MFVRTFKLDWNILVAFAFLEKTEHIFWLVILSLNFKREKKCFPEVIKIVKLLQKCITPAIFRAIHIFYMGR